MIVAGSLSGASDRLCIRPPNQLLKVIDRHGADINDCDPVKSGHVPGWLDARHVGQLQEAFRSCANTETPLFRLAGLEVSELFAACIVNKHIARRPVHF